MIDQSWKEKKLWPGQQSSIIWPWGQRLRSNECHDGTSSNGDTLTNKTALTFLERQNNYGMDKFRHFCYLGVKGQSQMNVMMVHNTLSNGHAPKYQISLPYLERQTSYGPDKILPLFDLGVKGQMNIMTRQTIFWWCTQIPNITDLSWKANKLWS